MKLPMATNLMISYAMTAIDILYNAGYNFNKAGVIVTEIVPDSQVQAAIWDKENKPRNMTIMKALEGINACMGNDVVRFVAQGYSQQWKLRTEYLSKCYTTRLDYVLRVGD